MLTVACVFVHGPYPYTAEYVIRLQRMVARYVKLPHRFVCLTDRANELPADISVIPIASMSSVVPRNGAGYWNKVRLFDPTLGLTGRVLYIDLDSIIVAYLDPIIDMPASLALTTDALVVERAHLDTDRFGRKIVRRFNSSVMVFDSGACDDLWQRWTPLVAQRLSTDQDWIGEQAPDAKGMPIEWFPRISQVRPPWPAEAIVVLVKKPKNIQAVERWPELDAWWGGWAV